MDSSSDRVEGSKRPAIVRDSADPSDEKYLRAMAHSDVDQRELLARSEALNQGLTQRGDGSSDAMPSAAAAPALLSAGKVEGGGSLLASQVPVIQTCTRSPHVAYAHPSISHLPVYPYCSWRLQLSVLVALVVCSVLASFSIMDGTSVTISIILPKTLAPGRQAVPGPTIAAHSMTGEASHARWSNYRLGDIFKFGLNPRAIASDVFVRNPFVCQTWPDSIGCHFLQKLSSRYGSSARNMTGAPRMQVLLETVREISKRSTRDTPSSDTVIVHVRLSDVLTRDDCWSLPPCVFHGERNWKHVYAYPLVWYDDVVRNLNATRAHGGPVKVVVVGSGHHYIRGINISTVARRSDEYLSKMIEYFRRRGFEAVARSDHLPDDDIIFMSYAKFLVAGGGGFSKIGSYLCNRNGGKVFTPMAPGKRKGPGQDKKRWRGNRRGGNKRAGSRPRVGGQGGGKGREGKTWQERARLRLRGKET